MRQKARQSKETFKMWGGRFSKSTTSAAWRYTSSIAFDGRLAPYDVLCSIAHARMLGKCGIISRSDSRRLVGGLTRILRLIKRGAWRGNPSAEDIHTQIEVVLQQIVGPVAKKLHTARSRNDQVSTDMRLYCREATTKLINAVKKLQRRIVDMAFANRQVIVPGYTHLQRAQPILLAHHLLAYVEMLKRDIERLSHARLQSDSLPLGSGALAGTSLPIDRAYVARQLGFKRISANSLDAVSDRDFVMELLFSLASLGVHLSRFAEDIILWASDEFGILNLDDAVATGSSLMPQKKNPDVAELVRGQAGVLIGQLTGLLSVMKGLPLSYNRDLQWDKPILFGALDVTFEALDALECLVAHVRVRRKNASALLDDDTICATDLADFLVKRGVAFREAHTVIGKLIAKCRLRGCRLKDLGALELRRANRHLTPEVVKRLTDPVRSVRSKRTAGGTGYAQVSRAIAGWRRKLS